MKNFFKFLMWFFGILVILIAIISVTVKLSENQITDFALDKVSESIDASVKIGNVNFNVVRKFPYASIELENVWLGASEIFNLPDSLSIESDSLLFIKKVYIAVNTRSFMNSKYEIVNVELSGLELSYDVDTAGNTNFDFLMSMDTTQQEEEVVEDSALQFMDILLSDLTLTDITLNFNDASMRAHARLHIPELNLEGKVYGETYTGQVKGSILLTDCGFEDYNVDLMQETYLNFNVGYENDSIYVNNINLNTDGLDLEVLGNAAISDSIYTDLKINLANVNLGELIKYAPKELLQEYGVEKVAGLINIQSSIKGYYADSSSLPQVDAQISITDGTVITKDYPSLNYFSCSGMVSNGKQQNNRTTSAEFSSLKFKTDNSNIDLAFKVSNIDKPSYWLKSNMLLNFADIAAFIPDSTVDYLNGKMKVSFETKGILPNDLGMNSADYFMDRTKLKVELIDVNTALDSITVINDLSLKFAYAPRRIDLTDLAFEAPGYDIAMSNTHVKAKILGKVRDMDHMGADIESFNFQFGSSSISGKAYVKDLKEPNYKLDTDIKLALNEFKSFISDTLLKDIGGTLEMGIQSFGTVNLDSIETQAVPIAFEQTNLSIKVTDFMVVEAMQDPKMTIDDFDLDFEMAEDTLLINSLFFSAMDMTFEMDSTSIWNVYKTIIQEQKDIPLIVQTNIKVGEINYDLIESLMAVEDTLPANEIAQEMPDSPVVNDTVLVDSVKDPAPLLPDFAELGVPHFMVRGKLDVAKVQYEKNLVDDISLLFRFTDSLYVIDQLKFKTSKGDFLTSVMLDARNWDRPRVEFRNTIAGLDLKELLENNDNFGDTAITSEKISGTLTSELHARAFYIDGEWPTRRIRSKGNFMLEDGKIYDYEPLVELSKSMKALGGLRELDKMDFNTLKTSIFFFKDKLYVPKTDIVSSSLDLSASALQKMNDDYEYHIQLHLGDVLTGKSDRLMEAQEKQNKKDGATVERNGINLVAIDMDGETKFGFDNDNLKKKFKNNLNKQHGFLNFSFNPVLVNFSTEMDRTKRNKELIEKYGTKKK